MFQGIHIIGYFIKIKGILALIKILYFENYKIPCTYTSFNIIHILYTINI